MGTLSPVLYVVASQLAVGSYVDFAILRLIDDQRIGSKLHHET